MWCIVIWSRTCITVPSVVVGAGASCVLNSHRVQQVWCFTSGLLFLPVGDILNITKTCQSNFTSYPRAILLITFKLKFHFYYYFLSSCLSSCQDLQLEFNLTRVNFICKQHEHILIKAMHNFAHKFHFIFSHLHMSKTEVFFIKSAVVNLV